MTGSAPGSSAGGPARAFIGLGSNMGDRRFYLEEAVATLRALEEVTAVSPVYETSPVGGPVGQDPYLNVVVELATRSTPHQLLELCRRLEEDAGRVRTVRFGPRTLDADVLLVGEERVDDDDLQVPHPRMFDRRFVLVPLSDLAPELVPPEALEGAGGEVMRAGTL